MYELQEMLCSSEDKVSGCHHERSAVADKYTLVSKEDTALGEAKSDLLHVSTTVTIIRHK